MKKKIIIPISIFLGLIFIYFVLIPLTVTHTNILNLILKPLDVKIEKPCLKTYINSDVSFSAQKIELKKEDITPLEIDNLKVNISLKGLFKKRLTVNNFGFDYLFLDANSLMNLFPAEENNNETSKNSPISLDLYNSILDLKEAVVLYSPDKNLDIKLNAKDLNVDNTNKKDRYLHFDFLVDIKKGKYNQKYSIKDNNKVLIKNKHLYINDCVFSMNKSNVHINAEGSREKGLEVNLSSKNFRVQDVAGLIGTNLIIPNGSEILSYFKNLKGDFDFDINLKKEGLDGVITMNKANALIVPLSNLPVFLNKGTIEISPEKVTLKDFEGYYGSNKNNKVTLEGDVNDYMNSVDTEVVINTKLNNEFVKNYLSKTAGVSLELTGQTAKAGTRVIVKSIYDKIDVILLSKLSKGDDILVEGASLTPVTYDRAIKADMHIEGTVLDIKEINYYIASELKKGVKVQPVVVLKGKFDISTEIPDMKVFGFEIPRPLPSEFLNLFAGQKLFKGGKFSGKLFVDAKNEVPVIKGKIDADEIRVPSQRLFIKNANLYTDENTIHIVSNGKFKRSEFNFKGDIKSSLKYPIVIRNLDFELDKLDLERLINSFNQAPETDVAVNNASVKDDEDDEAVTFDFNNLIVERCVFKLKEGSYKDIKFGNLGANLTLNKENILELKSNKFDIAEGISTIKVLCDLNKHKYYLRLGVKDVNSDIMSTTLLNLPKEISGKASGLIELNTDDSMKLNGIIKFAINNGQIQKIGLVEYLMKFASLFRNPLVTISPSIFSDIVNIPEGNFDKISGELNIENNFVKLLRITSSSPQLSSYIIGCYNLENSDAILRIYTQFSNKNKGAAGFLRKFSLSSLANRMPLSSRNDAHYYAAELKNLPHIDADEKDCQIFLTTVDGDIEHNNFISSLKKIK